MKSVVFAAFGVTAELTVADDLYDRALEILPPGWQPGDPGDVQAHVELSADGVVVVDGEPVASAAGARQALGALDAAVRARVSLMAPEHVFVHAGVVADDGRAIVMPGSTLAGKSTLVAALLRHGAEYCSDEFAVLDERGLLHPYPKPLSLRWRRGRPQHDVPIDRTGAVVAEGPLPVGMVVVTRYEEGARWNPRRCEPAEGALALLEHTIPVRSRPAQAMTAVRQAAAHAIVLEGPRGSAGETARELLAAFRSVW